MIGVISWVGGIRHGNLTYWQLPKVRITYT